MLFTPTRYFFCDNGQNRRTLAFFYSGEGYSQQYFHESWQIRGDRFRRRHEKRPDFLFTGCHPHRIAKKVMQSRQNRLPIAYGSQVLKRQVRNQTFLP